MVIGLLVTCDVAPLAGVKLVTVGGVASMVTAAFALAALPAASYAMALMVAGPVRPEPGCQKSRNGAVVSSGPTLVPFTWNCTPVTPMLSDAAADSRTVPPMVDPTSGRSSVTVGGVVSGGLFTVTEMDDAVVKFPAKSRARADST